MPSENGSKDGGVKTVKAEVLQTASCRAHARGEIVTWEQLGYKAGQIIDIELYPIGSRMLEWYVGRVQPAQGSDMSGKKNVVHGEVELVAR